MIDIKLVALYQKIAPEYLCEPMINHMRHKFKMLSDIEFYNRYAECLKFLFLRSVSGRGFIPLSGEIDDFWHALILQTKEYEKLCHALPGKHFIHHNSISIEDYTEEVSKEVSVERLLNWIPNYTKHFGPFSEITAKYWMIVQLLRDQFDYSLDEINLLTA